MLDKEKTLTGNELDFIVFALDEHVASAASGEGSLWCENDEQEAELSKSIQRKLDHLPCLVPSKEENSQSYTGSNVPEKKEMVHVCPRCGGRTFGATAHVTQDWQINERGEFIKSINDCVETTHYPNDDDIWDCSRCGYSAEGSMFLTEQPENAYKRVVDDLGRLAIPKDFRKMAGIKEGDSLCFSYNKETGDIILRRFES